MSHGQLLNRLREVGRRICSMKGDVRLCKWSVQHIRIVAYTSRETPSIMPHMDYNSRRQHRCSSSGCNFVRLGSEFVRALQAEVRPNIEIFFLGGGDFHKLFWWCWFWNFRRDVDEICALLGCYAALSGSSRKEVRENLWRWDRQIVSKRWYGIAPLQCVISHKSANQFRWYFSLRNNCWDWKLNFRLSETRCYQ